MITWFKRAVGTAPAKSSDRLDETPDFLAVEDAEATAVETAPPAPPPPARKPPPAPSPAGKPAAPEAAMPQAEAPAAEGRLRAVAKGGAAAFRSDQKSLYRELLKGMYDAVLVTDPKGHVIDSNPRVADILLYPAADIWDMPIEKLVRGLTPPMLERIRQTVAGNRHVLLDATCRRRDGTTFAAEVAISRLNLINEGDFVFFIRNVERRRQTMQRLRSLQNAVMNAATAFATLDLQGRILFANPAMLEMWSAARSADLLERNIRSIWQSPAGIERALELALGGDRWIGPLPALGFKGRRFTVEAMLAPDRDARNEIVGVVCSFIEVAGVA